LGSTAVSANDFNEEGGWRLSAYLWGMSLDGTVGIGPVEQDIDLSFSDLLSALDIGGALVGRYDRGAHTFVVDFQYYSLKPDSVALPGPLGGVVSSELQLPVINAFYGHKYRVGNGYAGPNIGFRYMHTDLTLNLDLRPEALPMIRRSDSPDFTDFTFGGFLMQPLGEKWEFVLQGDVGVGGSEGTYQAQLMFRYITASDNRWNFGARIMGVDFDDRLPSGELFAMDTTMAGLTVGYTWGL
ncbi:MAG: hypothetical protein AAGH19_07360, partial [Pseudomonadota bacterium]